MVFSTWLTIKMSLLVIIILLAHRHMQFYFCFIFYENLNYQKLLKFVRKPYSGNVKKIGPSRGIVCWFHYNHISSLNKVFRYLQNQIIRCLFLYIGRNCAVCCVY